MATTPVQTTLTALELARAGRFAEIRDLFAPQLQAMVPPEALKSAWEAELGRQGAVSSVGAPVSEPVHAAWSWSRCRLRASAAALRWSRRSASRVSSGGLQLAPPALPSRSRRGSRRLTPIRTRSTEQEVALGSGTLAVPGTMTVPRGPGPHAGVVLLAGSGSLDRDETIGRNKPFKDIAWGLASRGVATLRFDKVTYAHAHELTGCR